MANREVEFPVREETPLAPAEFPQPLPETEYRPPDAAAEDSAPAGGDYANPPEEQEFSPPGSGREESYAPQEKKKRLRRLICGAAALVMLGLIFFRTNREAPAAVTPLEPGSAASAAPTAEPTVEPTAGPLVREPEIEVDFFAFSHEHHARVRMSNTGAVHSVRVSVRETVLDQPVYEHELSGAEIEGGLFELPALSTGDYFGQNMEYFRENSSWPKFELTLEARYENEAGDGEDTLTITREPYFELGVGVSSMGPDDTWNEYIPADCFYVQPWEDFDDIRFVIDDPDAVTDPMTFSVDMSWNGRHAEAGEYEEILKKDEYTIIDADGGQTPYVGYTKILVLRRPDWMPEEGTLHVTIVQILASTGERWVREYDLEYPIRYDWDF